MMQSIQTNLSAKQKNKPHGYLIWFNTIPRKVLSAICNQSIVIKLGYECNKATRPQGMIKNY